ncbi:MAG: ferritin family protein [Clostridium sp.]
MKIYGSTKGTELEKTIEELWKGEAMAAGMYFALAHIAKEQGKDELAESFTKIGSDEARHSGLYAYLNGMMNEDIMSVLPMFIREEEGAYPKILELSEKIRGLGLNEAADLVKSAALDEKGHQKLLEVLINKN